MENEILSWAYWSEDKSEIVRNLGLAIAAFLALPFLIWRTIALNKSARAALESSKAAFEQSKTSLIQSESSRIQAQAALDQAKISGKQIDLLIKNRFSEHMMKAFEQLSGDNPSCRLGAIYTLERLAAESEDDRNTITKVLTMYLVSTSKFSYDEYLEGLGINKEERLNEISPSVMEKMKYALPESKRKWPTTPTDKEAIINILGSGLRVGSESTQYLDFRGVNLQYVSVIDLDFSGCSFRYSDLTGMKGAGVNYQSTDLTFTLLIGADLHNANLKYSALCYAEMKGANLENANLEFTTLSGANPSDSKGLTQEQLNNAFIDEKTIIPDNLEIPKN
jgi:hypothetical protein